MSNRDRMVIVGLIAIAILGVGWVKFVSPERSKVSAANAQIETARQQLQTAEGELSGAQKAQAQYAESYASIVSLGKAVPASEQTPALLYELDQATGRQQIEFATFVPGASSAGSSAAAKEAASTGFKMVPFSFTFKGNFARLYALLNTLQGFALSLTPVAAPTATTPGAKAPATKAGEELSGTITATAYVLPASALAPSATTAPATGSATPSSSAASASSATATPATIKAVP
jgi:hypothetical protein